MIVYKVTNQINGKVYIGQTSKALARRRKQHVDESRRDCQYLLHRAIRKHGAENFAFETLCECSSKEEMDCNEMMAIKEMNTRAPVGYNLTDGGEGCLGRVQSEGTRRKISDAHKGKIVSPETRKKLRMIGLNKLVPNALKINQIAGRKLKTETKAKLKMALMGNKRNLGHKASSETRRKLSVAHLGNKVNLGREHTEDTKRKIGAANKGNQHCLGRKASEETKTKMSSAHTGFRHSPESKKKMEVSWIIRKHKKHQEGG